MKILLLSDSHNNLSLLLDICSKNEPFDMIFHLGDGERDVEIIKSIYSNTVSVSGNNDISGSSPKEVIIDAAGLKVLLTHGDLYGVKRGLSELARYGKGKMVDIIFFGHTHIPFDGEVEGIQMINPGSIIKSSIQKSYAVVNIWDNNIRVEHFYL